MAFIQCKKKGAGGGVAYKNYARFTNGGFYLPYSIDNSDYKITVEFNDTVYKNGNGILENTRYDTYFRFGVFNYQYYMSSGYSLVITGTWSAGQHKVVINKNNTIELDDNYLCNYNAPSNFYSLIGLGCGNIENGSAEQKISPNTYVSEFKIESISTGDVICDLKPALVGNIPCMYDLINDIVYSSAGMEVIDSIPN